MTDLFMTILSMSLTASYAALAVIFIRMLIRKIPSVFSYILWLPVFIRLVFPLSFHSKLSFFGLFKTGESGALKSIPANNFIPDPVTDMSFNNMNGFMNASQITESAANTNPAWTITDIACMIWISGMVAIAFYVVFSFIKIRKNTRTATLVKKNIYETDRITTPFVWGIIKPKIYIPTGISKEGSACILAHEEAHIKRMDHIIKPIAFSILILHWFNPLIWLSFLLMGKDMEMSCDESVIKKMGNDIKGSYANSLLAISMRRSRLPIGSPLAFGESSIQSRIKNVLSYKKPIFGVVVAAVVVTIIMIIALTSNPKYESSVPTALEGYNIDALMSNKTSYVGNNSKVVALIDAMPLPEGMVRDTVVLQTSSQPYEITIKLIMNDASGITREGAISEYAFLPNSILLFSLIDNVDMIHYKIVDHTGENDGASYDLTYTREMAEMLLEEDVRNYAKDADEVKNLIEKVNNMSFEALQTAPGKDIEKYLEIIMSSPKESSNPQDYINAHIKEYTNIVAMGDTALDYLLTQFENNNNNGLREYIIMSLCKDILGDRNNVKDESLSPQAWFSQFSQEK